MAASINQARNAATRTSDDIHTVPAYINGAEALFSSTFNVHSPPTGSLLHRSTPTSIDDALPAVAAAQAAFPAWRDLPPSAKRDIFLKVAQGFESRTDELMKYMIEETGLSEG